MKITKSFFVISNDLRFKKYYLGWPRSSSSHLRFLEDEYYSWNAFTELTARLTFLILNTSHPQFAFCALWYGIQGKQNEERIPPQPYAFSYSAGRMPGHVDRVHSEVSDGSGTIRGMFSYLDPRQKIRTIEYIADKSGFHPILITNPVQDTTAVENAKAKHLFLYSQIAAEHQKVSAERGQENDQYEDLYEDSGIDPNVLVNLPQDTPVVEKAKLRHYDLYNRIAEEHARIAAERGDFATEDYEVQPSEEKIVKIGY